MIINSCLTATQILNANGRIINNPDGTISVYTISSITGQLAPLHLTKPCCERLGIGASFDTNTQECRWAHSGTTDGCDYSKTFNLVLNPKGNDGTIFSTTPDEVCTLDVEFDYLFKFDCEALGDLVRGVTSGECKTTVDVFESIAAGMSLSFVDMVLGNPTLTKVYQEVFFPKIGVGNLYSYLVQKSGDTGFWTCGTTGLTDTVCRPLELFEINIGAINKTDCTFFEAQVLDILFKQSGLDLSGMTAFKESISENAFSSNWLTFKTSIVDPVIISAITNEKIKLTVSLSGSCIDGCVLLDNIKLTKNSTKVLRNDIFLSKSPSFELDRIRDNKKSWIANTERTHREFNILKPNDSQPIRHTDYYLDDERQIINSKEVDLDINIASAVETDVWCYISDNPCILTGFSECVVYTSLTISDSVVSTGVTTGFTCPEGYSATPNNECCKVYDTVLPLGYAGTGSTITAGTPSTGYGLSGTYFYPNLRNYVSTSLPAFYSGGVLINQTGGTINPLAISTGTSFWSSLGSTSNGRLNNVGIGGGYSSGATDHYGFTYNINIATGGTYYVGMASKSNYSEFKVNQATALFNSSGLTPTEYNRWNVFEINLCSGLNIIETRFIGIGSSDFGFEIYKPTNFSTLTAATNTGLTGANVIFSTLDKVGGTFDIGTTMGYTCIAGRLLNTFTGSPVCTEVKERVIVGSGQSISITSTTITSTSGTTTGGSECCDASYVSSVVTVGTGLTYTCPAGYSATPANDACQQILTTAATFNGSGTTIVHGDLNPNYVKFGSYFYPSIQNNGALPVFYNVSAQLRDQTGGTITANNIKTTGSFWFNSGNTTDGRLNVAGISATTSQYLGFSQCINSPSGGTYYVGMAADNHCRFKLNGVLIASLTGFTAINFNFWSVFPVQLNSGLNIIEMEGLNDSSASSFAAEIYKPIDYPTLTGATNTGSTGANVIFSTLDRVGTFFDLGTTIGYSCPIGYSLDTCGAPICTSISSTTITFTGTNISTTATTGCCSGSCGDNGVNRVDINDLLTQPLSAVTTIEDFQYYLTSELIDAKNRKVIQSYPTLRSLYDRYMNSTGYCGTNSSRFDYQTMDRFSSLIGNYWVDIIEQVIPATTIWGSTKIYTNTIFDKQKYKYRGYSSFFGDNTFGNENVPSPITGTSISADVTTTVIQGSGTTLFLNQGDIHRYDNTYIVQMNRGSEFIGTVNIVGPSGGNNVINEPF